MAFISVDVMKSLLFWIAGIIVLLEATYSCTSQRKTSICESCKSVRFDTSQARADSLLYALNCGYRPFSSFKISSESYVRFDSIFCRRTLLRNGNDSVIVLEPLEPEDFKYQPFVEIESPCFLDENDKTLVNEEYAQFSSVNNTPFFFLGNGLFTFRFINSDSFIILNIYLPASGTAAFISENKIIGKTKNGLVFYNPVAEDERVVMFLQEPDTSAKGNIIVERIPLNPVLKSVQNLSESDEETCPRKVFLLGDSVWHIEHIIYPNGFCLRNNLGQSISDTLVIGTFTLDVQKAVTAFAKGNLKSYYQRKPINLKVVQLWHITCYGNNYLVICFEDSSTISSNESDMLLLIYDQTRQRVDYLGSHVESPNMNAFFGDFNNDKVLDFVSWNFGKAIIYSLDKSVKKLTTINADIESGQITDKYDIVFKPERADETYPDYAIFFNKGFYPVSDYRTW